MIARRANVVICALVMIYMVAPMVLVAIMSFSASALLTFPPPGFSLRWYQNLLTNPTWLASLWTSCKIMLLTAPLATALGTSAAMALARGRSRLYAVIRAVLMAPLIVPGIVTAAGIYLAFSGWGLSGTMAGIVLAHTVLAMPYVLATVTAALQGVDRRLGHAAATLGAPPWTVFRRITLPLILPGVLSGLLFAAVLSFDELLVSLFLGTPRLRTVPVQMWSNVMGDIDPAITALACVILAVSFLVLLLQHLLGHRPDAGIPTR